MQTPQLLTHASAVPELPLRHSTLVDVLRFHALTLGSKHLYTFLPDDDGPVENLSFAEVDRRARAIAAALQKRGGTGQRALLLYPPGGDYAVGFLGCLYSGTVAVPAFPPDPMRLERTLPRLLAIIRDSGARFALTTQGLRGIIESMEGVPELSQLEWLTTDELAPGAEDGWKDPGLSGSQLAFLQYTSGSTGTPKGVMVSHGNLMDNEARIAECFGMGQQSTGVCWLPPYHDMGLIGNLLQPIFMGFTSILMSPLSFLQRPMRWLEAISRFKATVSGGPNFAYELCARKARPQEVAALDLSSWRVAYCGAEPIRPDTLAHFAEVFKPAGFSAKSYLPCYGLAEATLLVTGGDGPGEPVLRPVKKAGLDQGWLVDAHAGDDDRVELVGCGKVRPGHQIVIADPSGNTERLPGEVGEIWLSGPSVTHGYWGRKEESEETFQARLADGRGPFLRTGDLGCFRDGELYVVGRKKDLIIIGGTNHYPQDIEHTVEEVHPALRRGCGAAFSAETESGEQLVIVQEVDASRCEDPQELIQQIRSAVALRHELHPHSVVLIEPRSIPKTSSGKIQRRACRAAWLDDSLPVIQQDRAKLQAFVAPRSPTEEKLAAIWGEILGLKRVGVMNSFFELGGHSLLGARMAARVRESFGVDLTMKMLFDAPTIAQLAELITRQLQGEQAWKLPELRPHPMRSPLEPVSFLQEEIWFAEQDNPGAPRDHSYFALRLVGELNVQRLEESLTEVVRRHEPLRTRFPTQDDEPRQEVLEPAAVSLPLVDLRQFSEPERELQVRERAVALARKLFDLSAAPPWRAELLQLGPADHVLAFSMHHIIADFWSGGVLINELMTAYQALRQGQSPNLPPLPVQYRDFVHWERSWLTDQALKSRLDFWRTQLAGPLPTLELPTDRPRPARRGHKGAVESASLGAEVVRAVKELGSAEAASPFMILLSAFDVLLHQRTGQEDLIVGSAVANRTDRKVEGLIGYFANMIPLRARVHGELTFRQLLTQVKEQASSAYANAELPPEYLMREIQGGARPSLPYRVALLLQGTPPMNLDIPGLSLEFLDVHNGSCNFDLEIVLVDGGDTLFVTLEYDTDLFDASTVQRLWADYTALLSRALAHPDQKLSALRSTAP